jgi:hypothetical protein
MAEQPPEPNGLDYGYESWKLAPTDPDAPMFGAKVAGVSLAAACRMRFQRGKGDSRQVAEITLEPRSAYVLAGGRPVRLAALHPGHQGPALLDHLPDPHDISRGHVRPAGYMIWAGQGRQPRAFDVSDHRQRRRRTRLLQAIPIAQRRDREFRSAGLRRWRGNWRLRITAHLLQVGRIEPAAHYQHL